MCIARAARYSESNVKGIRLAAAYNIDIDIRYTPIIDFITLPDGTFLQRRTRIQYSSIYIYIYTYDLIRLYLRNDLPVFVLNNVLENCRGKNTIKILARGKLFVLLHNIFQIPEIFYRLFISVSHIKLQ